MTRQPTIAACIGGVLVGIVLTRIFINPPLLVYVYATGVSIAMTPVALWLAGRLVR